MFDVLISEEWFELGRVGENVYLLKKWLTSNHVTYKPKMDGNGTFPAQNLSVITYTTEAETELQYAAVYFRFEMLDV